MNEGEAQYKEEETIPTIETEGEIITPRRGGFKGRGYKKQPKQKDRTNEDERTEGLKKEILEDDEQNIDYPENRGVDTHTYDPASIKELEHGRSVRINGTDVYVGNDGKPLNPFWEEQAALLSPWEKFTEKFFDDSAKKGYKKVKNFLRPLALKENPDREEKRISEYEDLVKNGQAELFQEMDTFGGEKPKNPNSGSSLRLYKMMKKSYKKGKADGYRFKPIGVYDKNGNFTGKMRIYRIKK
jgi:hypothetical protein